MRIFENLFLYVDGWVASLRSYIILIWLTSFSYRTLQLHKRYLHSRLTMDICVYRAVKLEESTAWSDYQLPEGFPFLVDDDTCEVIEPALLFLVDRFMLRGKARAINTLESAVYDLVDIFRYLHDKKINWRDIDAQVIVDYRDDRRRLISKITHRNLENSTINRRIGWAFNFKKWSVERGFSSPILIKKASELSTVAPTEDLDASYEAAWNEANDQARLDRSDVIVKSLTLPEWRLLQKELGPLPSASPDKLVSNRDRLSCETSIASGLRVDEIANLTIFQILELPYDPAAPLHQKVNLKVTKTKGLTPRSVEIPMYLVKELREYIDGERNLCLEAARNYWLKSKHLEPKQLFLNSVAAKIHAGKPVRADTLAKRFREAVLRAGLVTSVSRIDPDTKEPYMTRSPAVSFHALRHTYALMLYEAEELAGNPNPWLDVKRLLGHKNLQTTMDIYLGSVSRDRRAVNKMVYGAIREKYSGN